MVNEAPRESSPIRISAFGPVAVVHPDGRPARSVLTQPKRLALLVYLAVAHPRRFCRRDTLLGIFWPERTDRRGRDALNNALSHLRRSLGRQAIVSRGTEEVGLAPDGITCDVAEFEAHLDADRHAEALELYDGDLLAGFHLTDGRAFERWLDAERTRLRERAAAAARELATRARTEHRPREGVRWAKRALSISALDESALRTLLTLYARSGRRAEAIRAYDDFRRRLADDIGAEPDPATRELIDALRTRSDAAPEGAAEAVTADATADDTPSPPGTRRGRTVRGRTAGPVKARGRLVRVTGTALAVLLCIAVIASLDAGQHAVATDPSVVLVVETDHADADGRPPDARPLGTSVRSTVERIRARLSDVDGIDVLGSGGESAMAGATRSEPRTLGRLSGAGLVVSTLATPVGDSVALTASVMEVDGGSVIGAATGVAGREHIDAASELADRVAGIIALHRDPAVRLLGVAPGGAPTYAAYREWSTGLGLYARYRYADAVPHFENAAALDSSFLPARLWAAAGNSQVRRWTAVDSLVSGLGRVRHRLAPFNRSFLDYIDAWRSGSPGEMHRAAARMIEVRPTSLAAQYMLGSTSFETHRLERAVGVLERMDAVIETRDWYSWVAGELADTYHLLGRYERALDVSRQALAYRPGLAERTADEVAALAALGRVDELKDRIGEVLRLGRVDEDRPLRVIHAAASELYVHRHTQAARDVLARGIGWLEAAPTEDVGRTERHRAGLARTLYLAGRLNDAERIYRELADERPDEMTYQGYLAAIAARRGEASEARRIARSIERPTEPHLFGQDSYRRARVEALLGERERALRLIERAFSEGLRWGYRNLHPDVDFAALRGWPPFEALMAPKGAEGDARGQEG